MCAKLEIARINGEPDERDMIYDPYIGRHREITDDELDVGRMVNEQGEWEREVGYGRCDDGEECYYQRG